MMSEIEYRAERAQHWRHLLNGINVSYHWEWCIHVGLWETSGWTDKNNRNEMLKWLDQKGLVND